MTIAVEFADVSGCKVIRLSGHVDHGLAARLGEGLREACLAQLTDSIIVDLSEVSVVDPVLVTALTERLREPILRGRVAIVSRRLTARRILRHGSATIPIYGSLEHAVRAQHAMSQ